MANNSARATTMRALPWMLMCGFVASMNAATWYVDSSATGSKNGTSWANAWTNVDQVSGTSANDIVYISGGPAGSSRTYALRAAWVPKNGVTYKIGQDAAHNGIATFDANSSTDWIHGALSNVVISGDAGDGSRHFALGSVAHVIWGDGSSHLRISYVNCGPRTDGFQFNGVREIELDHCYFYKLNGGEDHAVFINNTVQAWDDSKFHDNVIYLPRKDNGFGDDGIQGASDGFSFYNNAVIGYLTTYTGGQHQDGLQPLGGSYLKFYSNYFQDIANYPIFGDALFADFAHFWVYDNIVVLTSSALQASDPPQGIAIGPDGGSFGQLGRWPRFTDVVVANNLVADYRGHAAINLRNNPGQSSTFTQCSVINNIIINSSGIGVAGSVTTASNISIALSSGSGHFVRYTPSASNNDFHLLASDTTFRGKGTNLSAYFSTDKDAKLRAPTGAWDIGPYVYSAYNAPPPPANLRVVTP